MRFEELKDLPAGRQGKKIAILGFGLEGISTTQYFLTHNIQFTLIDEKSEKDSLVVDEKWGVMLKKLRKNKVPMILGQQFNKETIDQFDVIVRSPGVSLHKDFLKNFKGEITSLTKLFFDNCPAKIIGVTGTKGKGTTSSLIYTMLKKSGFDAYLGGNIGKPPFDFLDTLNSQSIVVLEMSSFQLEDMQKSPQISVMLMVTREHLDDFFGHNFHKDLQEYWEAKRNIVKWQNADDITVLNTDYSATRESAQKTPAKVAWVSRYQEVEEGCFVRDNKVILRTNGQETEVIDAKDILLPGGHNLENVCAATMASYAAGVNIADIAFVLRTFKGLEHRLELVRELGGVRYYDDSFSTVPETAIAAISAFSQPEILILGGSSKNSDFTELGKVISEASNIKAIVGIGIEWEKIKYKIQNTKYKIQFVEGCKTMKEVVKKAHELAESGDIVLLSPACASFDMFANYKDRGNQFKQAINML